MPPRTRATAKPVEPPRERPVKGRRWRTPREVADADPFAPESNAVYRLYNGVGALLYVGISDHPKRRFGDHSDGQPWWGEVARWEVRWTASRALALAEEARAIRDEVPAFNIAGVPSAGDAVDLHAAWLAHFRGQRPTRQDLNQLYLSMEQIHSLRRWPDARLPFDLDTAVELLEWARGQARLTERWAHRQFVTTWMKGHAADLDAQLPDWTASDGPALRWLTAMLDRPYGRRPAPRDKERTVPAFRPSTSVRTPDRVAAETFAGASGLLCSRTELPVHDCDCHSRHVVSAFEERRFGLPMGAPFGVEARPWKLPVKHRVLAALRRYVA